jgi:hypothetical protein
VMGAQTTKTTQLTEATPIGDVVRCHRGIVRSEQGSCGEGTLVHKDDPRVVLFPECFQPVFPDCILPFLPALR